MITCYGHYTVIITQLVVAPSPVPLVPAHGDGGAAFGGGGVVVGGGPALVNGARGMFVAYDHILRPWAAIIRFDHTS